MFIFVGGRYKNDPIGTASLSAEELQRVLGGGASMWGEQVDDACIDQRAWPRASAVAERLWSAQSVNDIVDATRRLDLQRCRMVRRGIGAGPVAPGYCDLGRAAHPDRMAATLKLDDESSGIYRLPGGTGSISIVKSAANPVIGPSNISGSQDFCGARDMGIARSGNVLNLVYSGYSTCEIGAYDHCGNAGCCQLMFSTLDIVGDSVNTTKATRLGEVLPAPTPASEFYPITTDAFMLFERSTSLWHMWATEMPRGIAPHNARGGKRQIGHLTVRGTADSMPSRDWSYESTNVFDPLPAWAPYAIDEPRVYPRSGGGWIMYVGSQGNNDEGSPTANAWCIGYATSDSLNGPWTSGPSCIIGSGNATGYQAEGFVSFSHRGMFFIITNSLSTDGSPVGGKAPKGWLHDIQGDLWSSHSQTTGWNLVHKGFVKRSKAGWDRGFTYITGQTGDELVGKDPLFGAYMGGAAGLPGGGPISIGVFALRAEASGLTSDDILPVQLKERLGPLKTDDASVTSASSQPGAQIQLAHLARRPQKFWQTACIRIGGSHFEQVGDELKLAKYDIVVTNDDNYKDICSDPSCRHRLRHRATNATHYATNTTWEAVNRLNPKTIFFAYRDSMACDDHDASTMPDANCVARWSGKRPFVSL